MSKGESNKALVEAKQELDAARESAKLKLHLLSLDAHERWNDLEKKFQTLREDMSETGEKIGETSTTAARDLARSIRRFVKKHL